MALEDPLEAYGGMWARWAGWVKKGWWSGVLGVAAAE